MSTCKLLYQESDWYKSRLKIIAEREGKANKNCPKANRATYQRQLMRERRCEKGSREERDLSEAKVRAERAARYAQRMAEFIGSSDLQFQTVEWQLESLARYNEKKAEAK